MTQNIAIHAKESSEIMAILCLHMYIPLKSYLFVAKLEQNWVVIVVFIYSCFNESNVSSLNLFDIEYSVKTCTDPYIAVLSIETSKK